MKKKSVLLWCLAALSNAYLLACWIIDWVNLFGYKKAVLQRGFISFDTHSIGCSYPFNSFFRDYPLSTIYFDCFNWDLRIPIPELEALKVWKLYMIKFVAIIVGDRKYFKNTLHFSYGRLPIVVQNIWVCLGKTFVWAFINRCLNLDLEILKSQPETPKVWKPYKIKFVAIVVATLKAL